ncbi:aldose 1-epimerase [Sandarakinorhabdus sp.]|uniref:aldose 1-epimerase n=1 Tax=Sandarakinorhabdus sp. TaxID=1916663 RepID=UPI00286DCF8E|nr:aldose 1-epimerase [Sandarakinorhabdus sp.]
MLRLVAADLELTLDRARGGGITAFTIGGQPLFIGRDDPSPLGLASFPLVPFSNRISHGRFHAGGRSVTLPRNHPADPHHPHAIHGMGWQQGWTVIEHGASHAVLRLDMPAGAWPWAWRAQQHLALTPTGFHQRLILENRSDSPMPAGIGAHPFLPCNAVTRLHALHRGEWQTAPDGLPMHLVMTDAPQDWWHGAPLTSRIVDTVYVGRQGPIRVVWPDRRLALSIDASDTLTHTVVYVPNDAGFFCVEPVSHMTNAVNRPEPEALTGQRWLVPGETLAGDIWFRPYRIA